MTTYHYGAGDPPTAVCVTAGIGTVEDGDIVVPQDEADSTVDDSRWFNCRECLVAQGAPDGGGHLAPPEEAIDG